MPPRVRELWSRLEEDRDNLPRALQKHFREAPEVLQEIVGEMVVHTHWPINKHNVMEKESKAKKQGKGETRSFIFMAQILYLHGTLSESSQKTRSQTAPLSQSLMFFLRRTSIFVQFLLAFPFWDFWRKLCCFLGGNCLWDPVGSVEGSRFQFISWCSWTVKIWREVCGHYHWSGGIFFGKNCAVIRNFGGLDYF